MVIGVGVRIDDIDVHGLSQYKSSKSWSARLDGQWPSHCDRQTVVSLTQSPPHLAAYLP